MNEEQVREIAQVERLAAGSARVFVSPPPPPIPTRECEHGYAGHGTSPQPLVRLATDPHQPRTLGHPCPCEQNARVPTA